MFGNQAKVEFEALLAPCLDGLYTAALRLVRNERDAEDLVQDAVMRGYRFFDKFERGTNFRAWMHKILTNTFINGYRRNLKERALAEETHRQSVEAELFTRDHTAEGATPEAAALQRVVKEEVIKAVDALPLDFRLAVIYADLQDFSYKEVAEILDVPVGTVMSRLFRGRKQLQKLLLERGAVEGSLIDMNAFRMRKNLG